MWIKTQKKKKYRMIWQEIHSTNETDNNKIACVSKLSILNLLSIFAYGATSKMENIKISC